MRTIGNSFGKPVLIGQTAPVSPDRIGAGNPRCNVLVIDRPNVGRLAGASAPQFKVPPVRRKDVSECGRGGEQGTLGASGRQVDADAGLGVNGTLNLTRLSYSARSRPFPSPFERRLTRNVKRGLPGSARQALTKEALVPQRPEMADRM
jgi:hypothetical protein